VRIEIISFISSQFFIVLQLQVNILKNQRRNRGYHSSCQSRAVFGIDFGTHFARIAVYDKKKNRPFVLPNKIDGGDAWECVIAKDTSSFQSTDVQWIVGKKAIEVVFFEIYLF
jgi:hypothetical protein